MKILHTADWQIGIKAVGLGEEAAREVREERFRAAERVVEVAREHAVDAIIVAGDVFEHNGVDRTFVQRTADIMAAFEGPVYLLPGNHDPLGPGSVWAHPCWKVEANLTVLKQREPVHAAGAVLYPCPCSLMDRRDGNPLGWITPLDTALPRIGIAHGNVENPVLGESSELIPKNAYMTTGLDYIALGHWHSYASYVDAEGGCHMAYAGTHETASFGARDSGQVLVVDIPEHGARPDVIPVSTSGLAWVDLTCDLRSKNDLERLRQELNDLASPGRTLVRLTLRGIVVGDGEEILQHIETLLETRFLYARLDRSKLHPAGDEKWLSGLPAGIIREAATRLCAMAQEDDLAARAALELHALALEELP